MTGSGRGAGRMTRRHSGCWRWLDRHPLVRRRLRFFRLASQDIWGDEACLAYRSVCVPLQILSPEAPIPTRHSIPLLLSAWMRIAGTPAGAAARSRRRALSVFIGIPHRATPLCPHAGAWVDACGVLSGTTGGRVPSAHLLQPRDAHVRTGCAAGAR